MADQETTAQEPVCLDKMKCEDCRWFYSPAIYGKHRIDCQALGSKRTDPACDSFQKPLEDPELTVANALEPRVVTESDDRKKRLVQKAQLGNLEELNYNNDFIQLIRESFILEKSASEAPKAIRISLQQTGQDFDLDSLIFNKYTNKLGDIALLYKLCLIYGLGRYIDDIVKLEIENRFATKEK